MLQICYNLEHYGIKHVQKVVLMRAITCKYFVDKVEEFNDTKYDTFNKTGFNVS